MLNARIQTAGTLKALVLSLGQTHPRILNIGGITEFLYEYSGEY